MQSKIYTSLIVSTDCWPQGMFTFLEMSANGPVWKQFQCMRLSWETCACGASYTLCLLLFSIMLWLSQSPIYDSPAATIYSCTCYNSLSPSPLLAVLLVYIRQSYLNSLCSRLRFRVRCYTVSDLVWVCNPFFNTFLIKNIIYLYPRLSSVTTGSRGWFG